MDPAQPTPGDAMPRAAECLRAARKVVVFTGAGASAESGIPTFRDDSGLWREFPPELFATWRGLLHIGASRPETLARFLIAVLDPVARAVPNPGHRAIAELEAHKPVTVITQNIDGLHQDAGSTTVHEIHGTLLEIVGRQGRFIRVLSRQDLQNIVTQLQQIVEGRIVAIRLLRAIRPLAGAGLGGWHRPNVVLFEDRMAEPAWTNAEAAARDCDCFLSVGTSGSVYPAAILPDTARSNGAAVITVGPDAPGGELHLQGPAGLLLPRLLRLAFPA